jgi:hypothetical protein
MWKAEKEIAVRDEGSQRWEVSDCNRPLDIKESVFSQQQV